MNYDEICEKLKELKIEDFIWVIYIAIIFLSWMANYLEKKYFLNKDLFARDNYRKIMAIIFVTLIVVYFYFFISSLKDLMNLKSSDDNEKRFLTFLSFIGSLLVLISGIIFLYIIIKELSESISESIFIRSLP